MISSRQATRSCERRTEARSRSGRGHRQLDRLTRVQHSPSTKGEALWTVAGR